MKTPDRKSTAKSTDWTDAHARLDRVSEALAHETIPPGKKQAILRQRAFELARVPPASVEKGTIIEVVSFSLGGENYGIDARLVSEVIVLEEITVLPGAPSLLRGLVNLRSRILPALNLKHMLGLPDLGSSNQAEHLILIDMNGTVFGLVVDEITGLREVPLADLHSHASNLLPKYLRGVTAGGFVVLDLPGMLPDLVIDETSDL